MKVEERDLDPVLAHRAVYIGRETAIRALGSVLIMIGLCFVGSSLFEMHTAEPFQEGYYIIVVFIRVILGLVLIVVGIGLDSLKTWGRIVAGILSGLGLMVFPGGTVFSAFVLFLLCGERARFVFSQGFREIIAQTQSVNPGLFYWLKHFSLTMVIVIIALLLANELP